MPTAGWITLVISFINYKALKSYENGRRWTHLNAHSSWIASKCSPGADASCFALARRLKVEGQATHAHLLTIACWDMTANFTQSVVVNVIKTSDIDDDDDVIAVMGYVASHTVVRPPDKLRRSTGSGKSTVSITALALTAG